MAESLRSVARGSSSRGCSGLAERGLEEGLGQQRVSVEKTTEAESAETKTK